MFSMMWFGILIPTLILGILLIIPKWRKALVWWEVLIPIVVTIVTIIICQSIAINSATSDEEYWGAMGYRITHQEPFAYDSECSETYACGESCSTDSNGNQSCTTQYCTRYVYCIENSPRLCYLIDNNGQSTGISHDTYNRIAKQWQFHKYQKNQVVTQSHGYTTYGDKYKRLEHGNKHQVEWNDKWETSEPMAIEKTYENRVQTLSHWGKVSNLIKKEYDLFEYPEVYGWTTRTIMTNKAPYFEKANDYLCYLNGVLNTNKKGFKKIRIWLLIWYDQPQEAAEYQKKYWKNGNKNEYIIMIGTNKNQDIIWSEVVTWCESDALNLRVRDHLAIDFKKKGDVYSGKLTDEDLVKFSMWLEPELQKNYIKPNFHKYDFISVQPSMFSLFISFSIILIVNIGIGIFVVKNSFNSN